MIKIDKNTCSGCGACVNVCPQRCIFMEKDKMGFLYPRTDTTKCVNCGLCENVCHNSPGTPILNSYAAQVSDNNMRISGSSGGIFSAFAKYILSQNGVVFGAAFDETFHRVKHIGVEKLCDLYKLQGSKYVQSDIGDSFQQVKSLLEQGRTVLFSGTLCQIVGLKAFLQKDYENLYLIDVICLGVPSPEIWSEYVSFLERKYKGKVTSVSFRDKRRGWKDYVISIKFDNGREYVNSRSDDLYMRGFLHKSFLRPTCFKCSFKGLEKASDITLGDLWGIENIAPDFDDNLGTSLVMISSEKGKMLLNKISSDIKCCPIDTEIAVKYNSAVVTPCKENAESLALEKEFGTMPIEKLLKKYCANSFYKKLVKKVFAIIKK